MNKDYLLRIAKEYAEDLRESEQYIDGEYADDYTEEQKNEYKDVYDFLVDYCIEILNSNMQYDFDIEFHATELLGI